MVVGKLESDNRRISGALTLVNTNVCKSMETNGNFATFGLDIKEKLWTSTLKDLY